MRSYCFLKKPTSLLYIDYLKVRQIDSGITVEEMIAIENDVSVEEMIAMKNDISVEEVKMFFFQLTFIRRSVRMSLGICPGVSSKF